MNALILAAGLGTRLQPFTNHHPKALATVHGKPVLQWNVEYLQAFGITNLIVNVHHFAQQIITAIEANNGWGSTIAISNETNQILETGGGILHAAWFLQQTENCVVLNADVLTDMPLNEMIAFHQKNNNMATLATTNRPSSRYLLFNNQQQLCGWKNQNTGEQKMGIAATPLHQKAFSGIQILNKSIFNAIPFSGKFSMIDAYLALCQQHPIACFDHSPYKFADIGSQAKIAAAEKLFAPGL